MVCHHTRYTNGGGGAGGKTYVLFYRKGKWALGLQEHEAGDRLCDFTLAECSASDARKALAKRLSKWQERSVEELVWQSNGKARAKPRFDEVSYAGLMTAFDERDEDGNLGQWTVLESPETHEEKKQRQRAQKRLDTFGTLFEAYSVNARHLRLSLLLLKMLLAGCLTCFDGRALGCRGGIFDPGPGSIVACHV